MLDQDALRQEALRINTRYVIEVVEAFGFCPWAEPARREGRVRSVVLLGDGSDPELLERVCACIAELQGEPAVDIGLLVFPQVTLQRQPWQHFAARVRERQQPGERQDAFALADFHPDAAPSLASPEQLVPFIRSSPDPTLQLVRTRALHAVRLGADPGTRFVDASALGNGLHALLASPPSLSERVARANQRTVEQLGVEHVRARLLDIARDRDGSYGRLGLPLPPWRRADAP